MASQLISLTIVMLVAALAPFVASIVPGRAVPEVVFLVFAGAILGPHCLNLVRTQGQALDLVSELGMAFLFLLAGYEVRPADLLGRMGAHASTCWLISLGAAVVAVKLLPALSDFDGIAGVAFAIMLTTTAYGTLAPIIRARELDGTPVGNAVTAYGVTGEVLPVLAMAFLLSTRSKATTIIVIAVFLAVCVICALLPRFMERMGSRLRSFLAANLASRSEPVLRFVVFLLVFLITFATLSDLDSVLGAFAAGFVLRSIFPKGLSPLDEKIEGIGNGFLIPVFFVVSGAKIDLAAAFSDPSLLVLFIALLVAIRGVAVWVSLRVNPETRRMPWQERFSATAYCVMALPLIVAITARAQEMGFMESSVASVLVTAGAITVLFVPVITSIVRVSTAAHPVGAVIEIAQGEAPAHQVWREHREAYLAEERKFSAARERKSVRRGRKLSSAEYFARIRDDKE